MRKKAGRYAAGAAGLALIASLAGCMAGDGKGRHADGGSHPATPQEVLQKAAKRLGAVTTYEASVSLATVAGGKKTHLYGEMASRSKPDQALQLDIPYTTGVGDEDAGTTQVLLGDRLYVKDLNLIEVIHKPWIGVSISDLRKSDTDVTRLLAGIREPDPVLHARMFTVSTDAHLVGRETAGGVPATRYQGTFALSEALTRLDAAERTEAQAVFGPFGATPYFEVWIDDQGLVRKINLVSRRDAKHRLNATMTYTSFDTPVSITAPPRKDVKNLSDPGDVNLPA